MDRIQKLELQMINVRSLLGDVIRDVEKEIASLKEMIASCERRIEAQERRA